MEMFQISEFETDLKNYFTKTLKYESIVTKVSNKGQTLFLKFPVLRQLGLSTNLSESDILMLRIDIT